MQPNMVISVLYIIVTGLLLGGFLAFKKTDKKLYLIVWLPMAIVLMNCFHTFVAAIYALVHIKVNILSIGIVNAIVAGFLWWKINKDKTRQSYKVERVDIAFLLVLLVAFVVLVYRHNGVHFQINYFSIDGAPHMTNAVYFTHSGTLDPMYHASMNHGLFIQVFAPLFKMGTYYKLYLVSDLLQLYLAGVCFFGLIRNYMTDRYLKVVGIIVAMLYVLGYPLNSTVFGFAYLGMCITAVSCMIWLTDAYRHKELSRNWLLILLMLVSYAVFESYVMFVPVVYLGLGIWFLVEQKKDEKLFSLDTIFAGLRIFMLPVIFGLWFVYRGIFMSHGDVTVTSQIAMEGGIYRNLYSNFMMLLPFAIITVIAIIKNKKNKVVIYMTLFEGVCMAAMFALGLMRKVSGYYYYKNYFLLWLLVFTLVFPAIASFEKQIRQFLAISFGIWLCSFMAIFGNVNLKIADHNWPLSDPINLIPSGDIYINNNGAIIKPKYAIGKVELYQYVLEELLEKEVTDSYYVVGNYEDAYWIDAITNQYSDKYSGKEMLQKVRNQEVEYIVVITESKEYQDCREVYDTLEKLYENESGFVARVAK